MKRLETIKGISRWAQRYVCRSGVLFRRAQRICSVYNVWIGRCENYLRQVEFHAVKSEKDKECARLQYIWGKQMPFVNQLQTYINFTPLYLTVPIYVVESTNNIPIFSIFSLFFSPFWSPFHPVFSFLISSPLFFFPRNSNMISQNFFRIFITPQTMRARMIHAMRAYSSSVEILSIPTFPSGSTVFSLVQPTGKLHLGNYLGAIRNWREICHTESPSSKYIFGIADLHAITVPQNPQTLKQGRYDIIASIIAAGVDPEKCILYHQSSVAEHTELAWILTCMTGMGYLNRMTQWKLKSQVGESGV